MAKRQKRMRKAPNVGKKRKTHESAMGEQPHWALQANTSVQGMADRGQHAGKVRTRQKSPG